MLFRFLVDHAFLCSENIISVKVERIGETDSEGWRTESVLPNTAIPLHIILSYACLLIDYVQHRKVSVPIHEI